MVAMNSTEAKHRAPDDYPTLSSDLADAYDILRAHYVSETTRQQAVVRDAGFALDALRRRQSADPGSVPDWRLRLREREAKDASAVMGYLWRMLAAYPERNRDVAVAP